MTDSTHGRVAKAQQGAIEHILRLGVDGFGPFSSAREAAERAVIKSSNKDEAVRLLVRSHVAIAGTQGFVTNIGGLVTLPVALPANVGAAYLVQSHLAAAIACVYGHDVQDDEVRTAILLCLAGNAGTEVLKQFGVQIGKRAGMAAIKRIPISVIRSINQRVGFMLLAKFGTKRAAVTLARGIPLVGGVVGGTVDATATRAVGAAAKRFFSSDVARSGITPGH